jgi:putative transposase
VRAGIVEEPADYAWSSYRSNALGLRSGLVTPHAEYLRLGADTNTRLHAYRELFTENLEPRLLQDIRESTNRNLALGNDRFKEQIEAALSRRVRLASPGRKSKSAK